MAVGGMHIRHDFNTWVDWEQKSVRTCCGMTTKRHLAGIPGLTMQPSVVETRDKKVWGWCMRCVNSAYGPIVNDSEDVTIDSRVRSLYADARKALQEQYLWEQARKEVLRRKV